MLRGDNLAAAGILAELEEVILRRLADDRVVPDQMHYFMPLPECALGLS